MSTALVYLSSAAGACVVLHAYAQTSPVDEEAERRARASAVRTVGAALWPAVLFSLVPAADCSNPALALPLLWNAAMWALDAHFLHHAPSKDDRPASLRLDSGSLAGLSFGLCGLLGAKPDSRHTHLFLAAIVGCVVLVLPSHNLEAGCLEEQLFESVQKAALMWCVGLLIAGVVLVRAGVDGGPRKK
tara:strand:+ start:2679 stop:3242 length:564 start_codon:yes stop_codon:yes gene_type:complete